MLVMGAVALLAVGCRSTKQVVNGDVQDNRETPVVQESTDLPAQKRTLEAANFTAVVDGINVSGQLRMAEDSVIWVAVYKLVELGRAKATVDSVWVNVPLMGRSFAGTYAEVSRMAKRQVNFEALQSILNSDDAERQIEALAATLGFDAKVSMGQRKKVERLSFPM